MTVAALNTTDGPYVGNGVTTAFPFTFDIGGATELQVYVGGQLVSSGFDVTLTAGAGGTVTFATPPVSGVEVLIVSNPSFAQDIAFTDAGPFSAESHDEANDQSARRDLFLRAMGERSIRAPVGETLDELPPQNERGGKIPIFNDNGSGVDLFDPSVFADGILPSGIVTLETYSSQVVGSDWTAPLLSALTASAITGGVVMLNDLYEVGGESTIPDGVSVFGARGTGLKRPNQIRTTTTSAVLAGGTSFTVSVSSPTGFQVGQAVMFVWAAGASILPVNPFVHTNPVITAINGSTLTILRNGAAGAIPSGATIQTASHLLKCDGNNVLSGFTLDGNSANQTEGFWISTDELAIQGSRVVVRDLHFKDSFSDAALVGGPTGDYIEDIKFVGCSFTNVGNNGIHYGNARHLLVNACAFKDVNMKDSGINTAHQDGAVIFSNDCLYLTVTGNDFENAQYGCGAFGSTGAVIYGVDQVNDDILIAGNTFRNCYRSVDIALASRRIAVVGNRMISDYTPTAGPAGYFWGKDGRFTGHNAVRIEGDIYGSTPQDIVVSGNQITNGVITVQQAQNIDLDNNIFNNSAITDTSHMAGSIDIYNSRDIRIDGGRIVGGVRGIYLQSSFAASAVSAYGIAIGAMRRIGIKNVAFYNQVSTPVFPVVTDAAAEMEVQVDNNRISSGPASLSTWDGITLLGAMIATRNRIEHSIGTAIIGSSRRVQNAQGNIINGAFAQDYVFTPYTSLYHAFLASANGAVTGPVSNVYSGTVSGGTADTWRSVAHTTTYSDEVGQIRIVPKSNAADYRGQAGWTDAADAAAADPFSGINYAWMFFNGEAFVAEGSNARTTAVAYAADDIFWVVRTAGNDIEYWKGGDGVTHTTGTLVFTSLAGADEIDALRGKIAIRNRAEAIEVRMFG